MNFELTEDQKQVRDWAKKLAQEVVLPNARAASEGLLSKEYLQRLSAEGLMTLVVPEDLGGGGLDSLSFSLVVEEIARACGSTGVSIAVTNMIADTIVREGTDRQKEQFISQLTEGKSVTASFCLTENASGSDASAMNSTAKKEGSKYILNGEKIYVTNGAFSEFFLVMAKTSEEEKASRGISAFLVGRDQKGVQIGKEEDKMGLSGSSTIRMAFDDVEVPEENRVLEEGVGFKIAMKALDGGRISVASQALGIAKAALECGIKYAKEREQFGKPISEFQAIQWMLADSSTELAAAELLIRRAACLKDQGRPFTQEASMAKLFTTEMAISLCDAVIQIHGGYGYIKEYPAERFYRDVRVTALYEGTSEIQRLVIARNLLARG